jgi:hypothetical protein
VAPPFQKDRNGRPTSGHHGPRFTPVLSPAVGGHHNDAATAIAATRACPLISWNARSEVEKEFRRHG